VRPHGTPAKTGEEVRSVRNELFNRRRAQRFAHLLETDARAEELIEPTGYPEGAGGPGSGADSELADYLRLTSALRRVPHPRRATAEPSFRTSARAMLVAMAEREGIGVTAVDPVPDPAAAVPPREPVTPPLIRSRRVRGALVVGLASGVLALSGLSIASGGTVPGDPLYPVKSATEGIRYAIAGSDVSRGQLLLGFARTRANEARSRVTDPEAFAAVLDDMDSETSQGVKLLTGWAADHRDPAVLAVIDHFVAAQRAALSRLRSGSVASRVQRSLFLLDLVTAHSTGLRAALACGAPTGRSDGLGPLPGTCPR
jgi:hypothetical protein